ncbi:MAG: bifunctional diaminohydroxyphosphoribosylaminopyrimidine deaminase/5-amino-6-(5-phosphoribosylamino)uracil reductase RibD [Candidatus Omnitrophota bacterium]|jgi:diaminohydroxyphosphoribosylaminopyrimidine deaminase/5-amino-6-(5-phosphoribosylamino)uracil reductase
MNIDEKYMGLALGLAKNAEGRTSPNPMVGAVIVKNGRIVGKGYHKKCGSAHAEVNAIKDAGRHARGATMYVTLEPCDHFGHTPPCTDAIIRSGLRRVVAAMKDPNPVNNGRGMKRLKQSGVETRVNILKSKAQSLNKPYIKFITKNMPYVTLKIAESLDGKIAARTGDSKWITSEDARRYVHRLRAKSDAVMVGASTVITDDPKLLAKGSVRQPLRIVVCGRRKIPVNARIFLGTKKPQVILARSRTGRVDLKRLLKELARLQIANILVEGGGELAASLIEDKLVDRFLFFIAPKIIGGRDAVTSVEGVGAGRIADAVTLKNIKIRRFKNDILLELEAA